MPSRKCVKRVVHVPHKLPTKNLGTKLWGITTFCGVYSAEPRAKVYCFELNINIRYWRISRTIRSARALCTFVDLVSLSLSLLYMHVHRLTEGNSSWLRHFHDNAKKPLDRAFI